MKILVTGGAGYVGTNLVTELLKVGNQVIVLDECWFGNYLPEVSNLKLVKGDIRDKELINNLDDDVEIIYHLANIANDPSGLIDSKLTWETNVLASKFLIEWAIDINVRKFIYASSGSVYGIQDSEKVTEDLPLDPISDYNKTKMISERVLLSYKEHIPIFLMRPATICGYSPRMRLDLTVNLLTYQALKNKIITVFGGDQIRPNVVLEDMIATYLYFLENDIEPGIYNVGFENLSVMQIANIISEKFNAEIKVTSSNDPRSYRLNSDKLLSTGFSPKYLIGDAINQIVDKYNSGEIIDGIENHNVKMMEFLKLKNG